MDNVQKFCFILRKRSSDTDPALRGISSQYLLQPLSEGGYDIPAHDFNKHFNPDGSVRSGFAVFEGKTSGQHDLFSVLTDLLSSTRILRGQLPHDK